MGIRKGVKRKWRLYRMGEFSEQEIICCNGSQVLDRLVFHTDVSVGEHEPHSSSPFKLLEKKKKKSFPVHPQLPVSLCAVQTDNLVPSSTSGPLRWIHINTKLSEL